MLKSRCLHQHQSHNQSHQATSSDSQCSVTNKSFLAKTDLFKENEIQDLLDAILKIYHSFENKNWDKYIHPTSVSIFQTFQRSQIVHPQCSWTFSRGLKALTMQKMFENEVVCHKTVHFGFGVIRAKNERRMIDDGLMIGNQLPICRVWQIDQIQLREALTATSDKYF